MPNIVRYNNLKIHFYMFLLTLLIGLLGHFVSQTFNWGLTGTGMFLIIAGIVNFIAYFFSDKLVIRSTGAKPIARESIPELYETVENLAQKAGFPTPKLYLINTNGMNAFATGRDRNHGVVVLTKGIIENLEKPELEGVIAHELSHINNLDIRLMAIVSILVGLVSIIADTFWYSRIYSRVSERDQSGATGIISLILVVASPFVAMLIRLAISRRQEFIADTSAAKLCGSADGLISALKKISRDNIKIPHSSYATSHLFFSNPFEEEGFIDKLFSTHPPIGERIKNLSAINF
jgi:heat shock protein HtpX